MRQKRKNKLSNISNIGFFLYSPIDKKILLHKRDNHTIYSPKKWDYFGGNIEIDLYETVKEALYRELYEELGITVQPNQVKLLEKNIYFIIFPRYRTRELKLGEGAGFAWYAEDELKMIEQLLTDSAKKYLRRFGWKP